MNWLYYLAEANAYLCVFYLAYCLFLIKETHYQLNRAYLLFSCVAAFVLPVLQLGSLKPVDDVVTATVNYGAPVMDIAAYTTGSPLQPTIEPSLGLEDYLWYAYIAGTMILLIVFAVKLFTLYRLIINKQRVAQADHKLVYLPESDVAFSFFNYLFIGTNARGANTIIRHELVHITQKHSVDILFLELLKIISWFNPCIYLLQNSLKSVHEYIADEQAAAYEADALTYSSFLVNNAYGAGGSSLTHSFFNYNLLKKRIIMLNQQRSGNLARLKYLLPVPLCAVLLCVSTLGYSKTYGWVDLAPATKAEAKTIADLPSISSSNNKNSDRYINKNGGIVHNIIVNNAYMDLNGDLANLPLFIINNNKLKYSDNDLIRLKAGASFLVSTTSMTTYLKGNAYAQKTWGKDAKNVVILLNGENADVKIVDDNYIIPQSSKNKVVKFPPPMTVKNNPNLLVVNGEPYQYAYRDVLPGKGGTIHFISANNAAAIKKWGPYAKKGVTVVTGDNVKIIPPLGKTDQVKFPPPIIVPDKGKALVVNGVVQSNLAGGVQYAEKIDALDPNGPGMEEAIKKWGDQVKNGVVIATGPNAKVIPATQLKANTWQIKWPSSAPKPKLSEVKFPAPAVVIKGKISDGFYKSIMDRIKYPMIDKERSVAGLVFVSIVFGEDNNVSYAKILRSPSNSLGEEVLRVVTGVTNTENFKPGQSYTLPIRFSLEGAAKESYPKETEERKELYYGHLKPGATNPNNGPNLSLNEIVIRGYPKQQ